MHLRLDFLNPENELIPKTASTCMADPRKATSRARLLAGPPPLCVQQTTCTSNKKHSINLFKFTTKTLKKITIMLMQIMDAKWRPAPPSIGSLCKFLAISGLVLYVFSTIFFNYPHCQPFDLFSPSMYKRATSDPLAPPPVIDSPTNLSHLAFGIVSSANTWGVRKSYIEAWWRPNITQGYVFLDKPPHEELLPWSSSLPPFRVSEDVSNFEPHKNHLNAIQTRIVRMSLETYREVKEDVRWYIMGDDDSVFFVDNLVDVLSKYDHTKYYYIGGSSECLASNSDLSFDMAFGGAGVALSYPLVAALAEVVDQCIDRYHYLYVSDHVLQSCIADLGVSLTREKGFHQIDLLHDISGLLSAHPQSPFVTLHHLDAVLPIFTNMSRYESVNHLMEAAKIDQSRLLQQTICYHKQSNWSFSISWGYTTQIYESILPRSALQKPLETFRPWSRRARPPFFMFNTRWTYYNNPCEAPHSFMFDSIEESIEKNEIVTTYIRASDRGLPACSSSGNHSADFISKIQVLSPTTKFNIIGSRSECCDIVGVTEMNVTEVKFRDCMKDEVLA